MNSTERHEARYQRRKAARIEKKAKALKEFGDFGAVFSFDHLYASYRASIKGVGWKASTQRYKSSALAHIAKTQDQKTSYVTYRHYLQDAVFLAGIESEDTALLQQLQQALLHPAFPLYLGRLSLIHI